MRGGFLSGPPRPFFGGQHRYSPSSSPLRRGGEGGGCTVPSDGHTPPPGALDPICSSHSLFPSSLPTLGSKRAWLKTERTRRGYPHMCIY